VPESYINHTTLRDITGRCIVYKLSIPILQPIKVPLRQEKVIPSPNPNPNKIMKNINNVKRCRDGMPKSMQTRQG